MGAASFFFSSSSSPSPHVLLRVGTDSGQLRQFMLGSWHAHPMSIQITHIEEEEEKKDDSSKENKEAATETSEVAPSASSSSAASLNFATRGIASSHRQRGTLTAPFTGTYSSNDSILRPSFISSSVDLKNARGLLRSFINSLAACQLHAAKKKGEDERGRIVISGDEALKVFEEIHWNITHDPVTVKESLDVSLSIVDTVPSSAFIKFLRLQHVQFTSDDSPQELQSLSNFTCLEQLSLLSLTLEVDMIDPKFVESFQPWPDQLCTTLMKLHIRVTHNLQLIVRMLTAAGLKNLETLVLSSDMCIDRDFASIHELFPTIPNLTELSLPNVQIDVIRSFAFKSLVKLKILREFRWPERCTGEIFILHQEDQEVE